MSIRDLKKITIIAILAFLLFGFAFFRKDEPKEGPLINRPEIQQSKPTKSIDPEFAEKEKLKQIGEVFAIIYNSFSWGAFSNIESLYPQMTEEMQNSEKDKAEELKKALENQPRQYATWRASLLGSEFASKDKDKATLAVYLKISKFAGAIVQKDTMVWVDREGNEYKGDENNLIASEENREVTIDFVKIGDEWKINNLKAAK